MARDKQRSIALKGMDLSIDEGYLPEEVARYIKGWTYLLSSDNANMDGGQSTGANQFVFSPEIGNEEFSSTPIALPDGINKAIGGGFAYETGKYYSCVWNSQKQHSIWELDANKRTVKKVIQNECLDFQYSPEHFINPTTRFTYTIETKNVNGKIVTYTWIFIADKYNTNKQINVDDAIATNGFTHSFFTEDDACCNICNLISLGGVPKPNDCISITPVQPNPTTDAAKPNALNNKVWQFRVRYIDVWGREGEHGIISQPYFNSENNLCADDDLLPRCVDLKFNASCKWIAAYDIEFRICGAGNNALAGDSEWKRHDRIYRYSDCSYSGVYIPEFWKRPTNSKWAGPVTETNQVNFDPGGNLITYRFCANKESANIPNSETSRIQNYAPHNSNSIFKLENRIGVANNTRGFNPLTCKALDNIRFGVDIDEDGPCDPFKKQKIVVYGHYYNPIDDKATNVRQTWLDNNQGCISYGRAGKQNGHYSNAKDNNYHYRQCFKVNNDGVENLVMYLANTPFYAIGVQGTIASGTFVPIGVMQNLSDDPNIVTRWEFVVPAGIYVGRWAAPGQFTSGFENTSANVIGMTNFGNPALVLQELHELVIDVRTSNYDSHLLSTPQAVMIWDLTSYVKFATTGNISNAVMGYARSSGKPIEKSQITTSSFGTGSQVYAASKTDHNGYFFGTTKGDSGINGAAQLQLQIWADSCPVLVTNISGISTVTDEVIYHSELVLNGVTDFVIKGRVQSCDFPFDGIRGVSVIYTNGGYTTTDINGYFRIRALGTNARVDSLIISNGNNNCIKVNCDPNGCDPTFAPIPIPAPSCSMTREYVLPNSILMKIVEKTALRGLATGKYACGIVLENCLGQETFVQANDSCYVEVEDMDNTSKITYDLTNLKVPSHFKSLSFYVTENLVYDDWMEWNVDYAVLEDSNGLIRDSGGGVVTNPSKVRIYTESLLYYTAYSQSNTSWQFLKGDLVKIFRLGNGTKVNIEKIANYTVGENYITIDYDDSMDGFVNDAIGAKIRFLRPKTFVENEPYFQLCTKIKLIDGEPESTVLTGILPYANVYRLQRSIPIYVDSTNPQEIVENVYDLTGKVVGSRVTTKYVSVPENINLPRISTFNHHSPSDFFGDHCWGRGRVSAKNRYEREHQLRTEISLSKGISPEGLVNYLHQFYNEDSNIFNEQQFSSITGVVCGQNIILAICSNDYFTLLYDQNEFTQSKTGQIYAVPATNRFGKPRTKVGGDYGCQQYDLNTITYRDGMVFYQDSQRSEIIKHNFEQAVPHTPEGLVGWLNDKIQFVADWNQQPHETGGKKYFHYAIDPNKKELLVCVSELNQPSSQYLNKELGPLIGANETALIDLQDKMLRGFSFLTPEYFGVMETAFLGARLIAFKFGVPWTPGSPGVGAKYNHFFGETCKKIYEVVFNKGEQTSNTTDKTYLYTEVYCKGQLLFASRVITESGQESRIMPNWWEKRDNVWMADFKCQINGQADSNLPNQTGLKAVIDGELLHGKWAKVRYVSRDADDDKYCELTAVICCFK